jgi:hypothetical protein
MCEKIKPRELLTEEQARAVKAALALAGYQSVKEWAEQKGLTYTQVSKVLTKSIVPNERYARALNRLVVKHGFTAQAAA